MLQPAPAPRLRLTVCRGPQEHRRGLDADAPEAAKGAKVRRFGLLDITRHRRAGRCPRQVVSSTASCI